jgi:hypothetical protein
MQKMDFIVVCGSGTVGQRVTFDQKNLMGGRNAMPEFAPRRTDYNQHMSPWPWARREPVDC